MPWTPIQGKQSAKGLLDAENSSVVITPGAGVSAGSPNLDGGIKPGATPDASNIYEGKHRLSAIIYSGKSVMLRVTHTKFISGTENLGFK